MIWYLVLTIGFYGYDITIVPTYSEEDCRKGAAEWLAGTKSLASRTAICVKGRPQ